MLQCLYSLAAEESLLRLSDDRAREAILRALTHRLRRWEDRPPDGSIVRVTATWLQLAVPVLPAGTRRPNLLPNQRFDNDEDDDYDDRCSVWYIYYRPLTVMDTIIRRSGRHRFYIGDIRHRDDILSAEIDGW